MKKKLEAELISIAHRILKLNNKSDIHALQQEARDLYEALTVLKFAQRNLKEAQPTIGYQEVEAALTAHYESIVLHANYAANAGLSAENQVVSVDENVLPDNILSLDTKESTSIKVATEQTAIMSEEEIFTPAFDLIFEPKDNQEAQEKDTVEAINLQQSDITFDDLLGSDYKDPLFVKTDLEAVASEVNEEPPIEIVAPETGSKEKKSKNDLLTAKSPTLNDKLAKGITVGLNDRVAFVKHLFNNSSEDYNRVLSQLITFGSYEEAKEFIDEMVKPDYDNWSGKDEYALRFMEVVEKKFS